MSRIVADGAAYEVRTGGSGPAVLLLHGFTGRGADWGPCLSALRRAHATVVVDLLGHGRSDAPADPGRHALERQAADLVSILRGLGIDHATVVGYSFGARLALRLVIDRPDVVTGLVLESPTAGIADPGQRDHRREEDAAVADRIERDGIEAFVDTWWETTPVFAAERGLPGATRARLRAERMRNRPAGLAASLRGAGQGSMMPLHERLAAIDRPALVVAGELDPIGADRARTVAAAIPGARFACVAGAGHAPHRETPAAFRRLVLEFLQETAA